MVIMQHPDSKITAIQSALLGQTFGLLMGVSLLPATYSITLPSETRNMFVVLTCFLSAEGQRSDRNRGLSWMYNCGEFGNPVLTNTSEA